MTKDNSFKILIVDDEAQYRRVFSIILEEQGYNTEAVSSGAEALEKLKESSFDLVLTDLIMDNINGIELLTKVKKQNGDIKVIIVTGYGTIDNAVEAIKKGAFSYFIKSSDTENLLSEIGKLRDLKLIGKKEVYNTGKPMIFSKNQKMMDIYKVIDKVAKSNVNILITGESGVGKEVVAKHIHNLSNRRDKRFIAINCQSLSENLLESELFGHEKGAFTGAADRRIGRFEEANGGSLFLDEIGETSLGTQVKLLRVLESRIIERIGNNRSIPIDIRLICATNRDLIQEINKGSFREDLYYRINTISIEVPPLRERREDITDFVSYFIKKMERVHQKEIKLIEPAAKSFLLGHDYPGNIRELRNIVERLVLLAEEGIIREVDLPEVSKRALENYELTGVNKSLKELRKEVEKKYIEEVIKIYSGNITEAANHLSISKRQLFNKINEFNINY